MNARSAMLEGFAEVSVRASSMLSSHCLPTALSTSRFQALENVSYPPAGTSNVESSGPTVCSPSILASSSLSAAVRA